MVSGVPAKMFAENGVVPMNLLLILICATLGGFKKRSLP